MSFCVLEAIEDCCSTLGESTHQKTKNDGMN